MISDYLLVLLYDGIYNLSVVHTMYLHIPNTEVKAITPGLQRH